MRYFKRRWNESHTGQFGDWGCSNWYFEVDDNFWIVRQIEVYDGGRVLKYHHEHLEDRFGGLSDQPLDPIEFAPWGISSEEFERVWASTSGQTGMEPATPKINFVVGDASRPEGVGAKIIVHVCNDIGAWGRGFVMALSRRWPEPELRYRSWYRGEENVPFELGQVLFVRVSDGITVANLIGQRGIRPHNATPPIRYEAVRLGLRYVASHAEIHGGSVHMPRIGCGLAGGRWEEVAQIVESELIAKGIFVTVYDLPGG